MHATLQAKSGAHQGLRFAFCTFRIFHACRSPLSLAQERTAVAAGKPVRGCPGFDLSQYAHLEAKFTNISGEGRLFAADCVDKETIATLNYTTKLARATGSTHACHVPEPVSGGDGSQCAACSAVRKLLCNRAAADAVPSASDPSRLRSLNKLLMLVQQHTHAVAHSPTGPTAEAAERLGAQLTAVLKGEYGDEFKKSSGYAQLHLSINALASGMQSLVCFHYRRFFSLPLFFLACSSLYAFAVYLAGDARATRFNTPETVGFLRQMVDLTFTKGAGALRTMRGRGAVGQGSHGALEHDFSLMNMFMPSPETVSEYMAPPCFEVGFFPNILDELLHDIDNDQRCVAKGFLTIVHDEVDIRAGLCPDARRNLVIGCVGAPMPMENASHLTGEDMATKCLAFIVSSPDGLYERVCAWDYTASLNADKLGEHLDKLLDHLKANGRECLVMSSDYLSCNATLMKRLAARGQKISIPDNDHGGKNLLRPLRESPYKFYTRNGVKISLHKVLELKQAGKLPKLDLKQVFGGDMQKVEPMRQIWIQCIPVLRKEATTDVEAHALAAFLEQQQLLYSAFDVKRIFATQPNPRERPVLGYAERKQIVATACKYFSEVRLLCSRWIDCSPTSPCRPSHRVLHTGQWHHIANCRINRHDWQPLPADRRQAARTIPHHHHQLSHLWQQQCGASLRRDARQDAHLFRAATLLLVSNLHDGLALAPGRLRVGRISFILENERQWLHKVRF